MQTESQSTICMLNNFVVVVAGGGGGTTATITEGCFKLNTRVLPNITYPRQGVSKVPGSVFLGRDALFGDNSDPFQTKNVLKTCLSFLEALLGSNCMSYSCV